VRYALIVSGVVVNIAIWNGVSDWEPADMLVIACPDEVTIGWTYDGEFSAP
jgi:hypothetical protein